MCRFCKLDLKRLINWSYTFLTRLSMLDASWRYSSQIKSWEFWWIQRKENKNFSCNRLSFKRAWLSFCLSHHQSWLSSNIFRLPSLSWESRKGWPKRFCYQSLLTLRWTPYRRNEEIPWSTKTCQYQRISIWTDQ